MIIGGPFDTIAEARDQADWHAAIRTETIELQGSGKPGRLWVAYVAELANGDTYRAPFSMEPLPRSRAMAIARELASEGLESEEDRPAVINDTVSASAAAIARVEEVMRLR